MGEEFSRCRYAVRVCAAAPPREQTRTKSTSHTRTVNRCFPTMITPFDAHGRVDYAALEAHPRVPLPRLCTDTVSKPPPHFP